MEDNDGESADYRKCQELHRTGAWRLLHFQRTQLSLLLTISKYEISILEWKFKAISFIFLLSSCIRATARKTCFIDFD